MLVPFVIDVESLKPDPKWTRTEQRSYHYNLLDVWQRIGLLAHDGERFEGSRLKEFIEQLPQNLRPLWQEVLQRVPISSCGRTWNGSVDPATLKDFCSLAQLALVDDTCAEAIFGFPEDCDEQPVPVVGSTESIDICRLISASQATQFRKALSTGGLHIESGDTFSAIWSARFKTLASAPIKQIVVVDRYAVAQHMFCPQTHLSGLERFLKLLDKDANGPRHVTIFSAWTTELHGKSLTDLVPEIKLITQRLPARRIVRIKLHMLPNTVFRDDSHDRFVRFGNYVWDIGLGLEVFEGAFAGKRSAATFKSGTSVMGYRQVEQALAGHASVSTAEVV